MARFLAVVAVIFSAVLLSSSDQPAFTTRDKAFYADPNLVNFVRPGLVVEITGAGIASDGTIHADFTLKDPRGLPLDRQGITTPGTVATSFVAAYIEPGRVDYIAYTRRPQTSPITNATAVQPAADAGGTYTQTGDGQYRYTFATRAPAGFNANATTTIGVWASRNLSEFDLGTNFDDDTFDFVPNGSPVTQVHEVVSTMWCNKCHDPLSAHGGARRTMPLCVLCHNPGGGGTQTIDPDTGNSIDAKVLFHKIHMGEELPSVQAGTPYRIIGFQQSVNDYSTVVFPADARNCQMCHQVGAPPQGGEPAPAGSMTPIPDPPPAQGAFWITHPSRAACGSCHDNVNFATGENHANLPQISDNQCARCHTPQGELPFDVSILGAHTIPRFAPGLPGVNFTLERVDNGSAGQSPTVTFTIRNDAGEPTALSDMALLNLVMAGPTADYQTVISESALRAGGSGGTYTYTFQRTVPAEAAGTWTVGIEGYRNITLLPGTTTQQVVRDAGENKILDFSVDGSTVAPHPVEVTNANCNSCHYSLTAHGDIRNQTQYCILCHNPTSTDAARRPADQAPPQSIDFPVMIHRIHAGEEAPAGGQLTPYIVYGFGNTPHDFSEVRFPGDLRNCAKCHVNNSQQLPLPESRIQVTNPRAFLNPSGPATAACTACHTSRPASSHALSNTTPQLGEACSVCHGPNAEPRAGFAGCLVS
jgi:OmcA/MtrC family decaheme c-type cytochrome